MFSGLSRYWDYIKGGPVVEPERVNNPHSVKVPFDDWRVERIRLIWRWLEAKYRSDQLDIEMKKSKAATDAAVEELRLVLESRGR